MGVSRRQDLAFTDEGGKKEKKRDLNAHNTDDLDIVLSARGKPLATWQINGNGKQGAFGSFLVLGGGEKKRKVWDEKKQRVIPVSSPACRLEKERTRVPTKRSTYGTEGRGPKA